ncbi:MAG: hypothetical protein ACYTGS_20970 [Planctomycetota bacterium]
MAAETLGRMADPFYAHPAETLGRMADPFYAHRGFVSRTRQFLKLFSRIHMIFSIVMICTRTACQEREIYYGEKI